MDAPTTSPARANATLPGPRSNPCEPDPSALTVREFFGSRKDSNGRAWLPRTGIELREDGGRIVSDCTGPTVDLGGMTAPKLHQLVLEKRRQRATVRQLDELFAVRGGRYRPCTLENFQVAGREQKAVVDALRKYRDAIPRRPGRRGELASNFHRWPADDDSQPIPLSGIVLIGPAGTGKDHLLAAMMTAAVGRGYSVAWISGAMLWAAFRSAIGSKSEDYAGRARGSKTEGELTEQYISADIFAISDPRPIVGQLTQYQAEMLYSIIDVRYNRQRPTWATINAATRAEAENAVGVPVIDRMRDGALSLACSWQSFRKSQGAK